MESFDQVLDRYRHEPPLDVERARIGSYRGLSQMFDAIDSLRARGGRVDVVGRSHHGAPLLRVELGPSDAKAGSLVVAGTHAMEWIGIEVALSLLDAIADAPGDRRWIAFPILNPDGVLQVERDLRAGRRLRFRRANGRGVDLNRNWPTDWRTTRAVPRLLPFLGGSGTHGGSEPEIAAVLDTLEKARREGTTLERAVSLHSFGSMLLLPYGARLGRPPNHAALHALADDVRRMLPMRYAVRQTARWVPGMFANGMELDHLLHEGMEPLLVECSRGGLSLDPSSWLVPFRWFNPPDPARHAAALTHALLPFLRYRPPA